MNFTLYKRNTVENRWERLVEYQTEGDTRLISGDYIVYQGLYYKVERVIFDGERKSATVIDAEQGVFFGIH